MASFYHFIIIIIFTNVAISSVIEGTQCLAQLAERPELEGSSQSCLNFISNRVKLISSRKFSASLKKVEL